MAFAEHENDLPFGFMPICSNGEYMIQKHSSLIIILFNISIKQCLRCGAHCIYCEGKISVLIVGGCISHRKWHLRPKIKGTLK